MLGRTLVDDAYCQGVVLAVTDVDELAKAVALILVQEFVLAQALANGVAPDGIPSVDETDIEDIIARRLHPAQDDHRDGFLFQLIMWLGAHMDATEDDLIALPHSQATAKGQDGVIVHRSDEAVAALTICEDKASENPRRTVREDVWPEIKDYEAGGREDELRPAVIATLGAGGVPMAEAQALVRKTSWSEARRYRVRATLQNARKGGSSRASIRRRRRRPS